MKTRKSARIRVYLCAFTRGADFIFTLWTIWFPIGCWFILVKNLFILFAFHSCRPEKVRNLLKVSELLNLNSAQMVISTRAQSLLPACTILRSAGLVIELAEKARSTYTYNSLVHLILDSILVAFYSLTDILPHLSFKSFELFTFCKWRNCTATILNGLSRAAGKVGRVRSWRWMNPWSLHSEDICI